MSIAPALAAGRRRPSVLRNAAALALFVALLTWFLLATTLVAPRRFLGAVKAHLRLVFRVLGLRVTVSGLESVESGRGCLYMANHVSFLDQFLLLAYLPGYFVGLEKIENNSIPLYGWAGRRWGQVYIHREDRTAAIESCKIVAQRLSAGMTVAVFPEGTRSPDGRLGPFKRGVFHIAVDAAATVVPVAIRGLHALAPRGSRLVAAGAVEIRIGRPIPPEAPGSTGYDALTDRVRGALEDALA